MRVRIQKALSEAGVLSRRAAEKEILCGNISVNGAQAQIGDTVDTAIDVLAWKGKAIDFPETRKITVMLNKPVGYVTTLSDEKSRKTVADLVADCGTRLWPCGRLDMYSEGLLLMSNDGELTNRITHPSHRLEKKYEVTVNGTVNDKALSILRQPLLLEDGRQTSPAKVERITSDGETTVLSVIIGEGKNRQIRRMCKAAGLKVRRLQRVAVGELKLGTLKPGKWRPLTENEISYLNRLI